MGKTEAADETKLRLLSFGTGCVKLSPHAHVGFHRLAIFRFGISAVKSCNKVLAQSPRLNLRPPVGKCRRSLLAFARERERGIAFRFPRNSPSVRCQTKAKFIQSAADDARARIGLKSEEVETDSTGLKIM